MSPVDVISALRQERAAFAQAKPWPLGTRRGAGCAGAGVRRGRIAPERSSCASGTFSGNVRPPLPQRLPGPRKGESLGGRDGARVLG